jgi:hypothetical protein
MTEASSTPIVYELRSVMGCGAQPGEEVPRQDPKQDPADPKEQTTEAGDAPARPMPCAARD